MAISKIINEGIGNLTANMSFDNGSGIDFSASEGSNASSSVLHDYEEGTWTPTLGASTNPTVSYYSGFREGRYVKIGKLVFATFMADLTSISGGSGSAYIGGLPYPVENNNSSYGNQAVLIDNLDSDCKQVTLQPQPNESYAVLVRLGGGTGGHSGLDVGLINSSSRIRGKVIYRT